MAVLQIEERGAVMDQLDLQLGQSSWTYSGIATKSAGSSSKPHKGVLVISVQELCIISVAAHVILWLCCK